MRIEIFYTPGCSECDSAHAKLREAAEESVKELEWRELNVLDDLAYAVELGVLTLPSIAVDGVLVFTSMPTVAQLREALMKRSGAST
ncbi:MULTISPECIES: thioredoxin family protein [unclassified Bradyrhizobium]|uniref:glutaredoxin family protein n=1 Tax=unclassified Bradyrhizobium TaxID=2631580 RepID=UPI001BA501B7|nr:MULTISPECIES: thioredoxin family protein [unclassified Bradyrhizobium]MBR1208103.1 thioredoxin family protein [Bradyrhizobium sp. AUGA SZCCT0124]MBR1316488.1 thioredoxin family protein [Bradyrhizobium sp. AUGA SZCCT0051]MBR1344617.1 thioredoxin family protein [Bradyrhizobium sp. AUGA SZCCT0105]MBR1359509.1 thioredoxin family protein [Bradyrhizobium sp. AUGA SZCCT0045]